ncbi:UNVERIFIED_CONTAM: hypothetical protein Sradi_2635900 [Sesamum radiatum]|uniref:Uncharacterized protein n=1 Tax=Sesamum radiatum TaxID=300843 RepID=A0AAW2S731_SESRA
MKGEEHSVKQPSIDNKQSSDDGDEQSVGEDSDFSDRLVDMQNEDTMQVKTFNGTHHYPRKQRVSHANAKWFAYRYTDKIWSVPEWPIDSMLKIMQKENKLLLNKSQLYRTKKRIEKMGCGTDGEQISKTHKGIAVKDILWRAAKATRMADFERAMNDMRTRNTTTFEWLMQRPTTHWSNSHFSTHCKSVLLLNNMSESFNHMVLRARSKHIVDMLETIRLILMKRVHMRRDQMMKHNGDLCPKIANILEDMKHNGVHCPPEWKNEFEIDLPSYQI